MKKKLKLKDLKIQSNITSIQQDVKGGYSSGLCTHWCSEKCSTFCANTRDHCPTEWNCA